MSEIRDWLEKLNLGQYADTFEENEIDLSALRHVSDEDLKEIGVALGSRRKILAAVSPIAPAPTSFDEGTPSNSRRCPSCGRASRHSIAAASSVR